MDVVVPELGDFADVEVIEILVAPGDEVAAEAPLLTIETDKAAMDVPSPAAGKLVKLTVAVGDRVSAGDIIAVLEPASAERTPSKTADTSAQTSPAAVASPPPAAPPPAAPPPAAAKPAEPERVVVPDLGDFADVEVIEILVAAGDHVTAEQGLVTLETDKAAMDVPAPRAGTVVELSVKTGDRVSSGDAVLVLQPDVEAAAAPVPVAAASAQAGAAKSAPQAASRKSAPVARAAALPPIDERSFGSAHASPSVRKLARELGVNLGSVQGSGRKSRVTADDVKAYVKQIMLSGGIQAGPALPSVPEVDFAKFGAIETVKLSRIQKISGPRLHASWVNLPHVTQHDLADITDLEAKRQSLKESAAAQDVKLTPVAFIMRACALALAEFPAFKSSLTPDGESLVMKGYTHIGFAADTPNGLVVPVIRDVDNKNVFDIARELGDLSARAREGKLRADDMQGGVFTISSLGGIGGTYFTPIINAPEVAILGVSRSQWQPVYEDGKFVPRLMLPLSLSYDHRVIDGAQAARFITRLGALLGDPGSLVERGS
jgi:pyruvate dehydrogenase E2 component (dihydrolipoamide acetyltransferase)